MAALARAAKAICRRVGEDGHSVAQVARDFGIGWASAMACVRRHGEPLVDDPGRIGSPQALGIDEHNVLSASDEHNVLSASDEHNVLSASDEHNVLSASDEHNVLSASKDHHTLYGTSFVDVTTGQLLDIVRGRSADDVAYWLTQGQPSWRQRIEAVGIDPHAGYLKGNLAVLPDATVTVDHFHARKVRHEAPCLRQKG